MRIPDVPVHKELPFSGDAVAVWTVSEKMKKIPKEEWDKMKPFGVVILPEAWAEIKKTWLEACLKLPENCEQDVEAIDDFLEDLDSIFRDIYKKVD